MDRARWLLKALHEASDEVYEAMLAADATSDDPGAQQEVLLAAWDLAVHERASGWHLEQILLGGRDRLELHAAEWLMPHPDASSPDESSPHGSSADADSTHDEIATLARTYARARRETCGLLAGLPAPYWEWSAEHPFRGRVTVEDLAGALHERDIETALRLTRARRRSAVPAR